MSTAVPAASTASHARIGHVNLSVGDLDRSLSFYRDVLGMTVQKRIGDAAAFMSFGHYHHDLCINTWHSKAGSAPPKGSTGLFHFAITYRALAELQAACNHVLASGIAIDDVVDHGPSLSVYLRDPDQNGVELNWDRPAETWWSADGSLQMGHRRITLDELLSAAEAVNPA